MKPQSIRDAGPLIGVLVSSVLLGVLLSVAVNAQTPPETTAAPGTFVIQLVDLLPDDPLAVTHRTDSGRVTAFVDGTRCATVDAAEDPPARLVLGLPEQPEACGTPGSRVTLLDGRGVEFWEHFVVEPGSVAEHANYATGGPADTGAPTAPAVTDKGGSTRTLAIAALILAAVGFAVLAARRKTRRPG